MTDGQVNYEGYSDQELREALQSIDPQAFPLNHRNLQAAIESRLAKTEAVDSPAAASASATSESGVAPQILEFEQLIAGLTPQTPVTYTLIAVNVAVFAAMAAAGAGIFDLDGRVHVAWGSNLVPVTVDGEWWRLGSSMFLHFGVVHLMLNMWVLYSNGRMVERMFGSTRFLILYLFAGMCGSLASAAWHPAVNSAGASGAIFGVLGGLAAFLVMKRGRVPREVIRAQGMSVGAFVLFNVLNGLAHQGIDNAAHFGGLAGGFLAGLALARPLSADARAEAGTKRLAAMVVAASFFLVVSVILVQFVRGKHSPENRYAAAAVWFEHREPQVMSAYNEFVGQAKAGTLGDGEFADRLAAEIRPFYSEAKSRLAWARSTGGPYDEFRVKLARYVALRYESLGMFADALRVRDADLAGEAMQVQRDADKLAQELNDGASADPGASADTTTIHEIFAGVRSADCAAYLSRAVDITRSPAFERDESKDDQVVYLWQVATCAMKEGEHEIAFDHADRATRLKPDIPELQLIRLDLGLYHDRPEASLDALDVLSRISPDQVRGADVELISHLLRASREVDDTGDGELQAYAALERAAYRPPAPYFDDFLRMGHARLLLERGRAAESRKRLVGITDIDSVVEMRVDRLYDGLRGEPSFEALLDVEAAVERDIDRSRKAMLANPRLMEAVYLHAMVLLTAMRDREGLALVQDALHRDADHEAFADGEEFRNWLLNLHGYFLYNLGRVDEGRAALREAAGLLERGDVNVSNNINYGRFLILEGRARDALELLPKIGEPSPYGRGWIELLRTCAGAQLGDAGLKRAGLEYLKAHESDNPAALTQALLCVDDLDAAAAQMIRRLENRKTRRDALLALQTSPPRSDAGLPYRKLLYDQYAALRARPDVRKAALAVGRLETLTVEPGSG